MRAIMRVLRFVVGGSKGYAPGFRAVRFLAEATGWWVCFTMTPSASAFRGSVPQTRRLHRQMAGVAAALLISVLLAICMPGPSAAAEIDRLLAAVNGKVLTQWDLEMSRRLNAVLAFGNTPAAAINDEINRMIDLELVWQEMQNFPMGPGDESSIAARMEDLRKGYETAGGLASVARQYGLSESDIRSYLYRQASILRFVDFRFTPFATPSRTEIEEYYREKLVPRLESAKAPVPPLADVLDKIEKILQQEKVNAAMEQWIEDLRRHARIEYFLDGNVPAFGK